MSIKNFFGGAIINYGATLPVTTGVPDGAVFLKTSGSDAGLYVYSFVQDNVPATIGDQSVQAWLPVTGGSVSVNAQTLDGLDSTAFQASSSLLNAISGLSTNGILVKTGTNTVATRAIAGDSTITISPVAGDGVASNITVSVNQANLSLNSIGGTLSLAKGGTGTNLTITQGGVIYGSTSTTLASTGAGTSGYLLRANGSGAPTWVNPATISVNEASSAGTADALSPGATINGVTFTGASNITITANTPTSLTFNNGGSGAASGTTFNGGTARTVSYNTIGACAIDGSNATTTPTGWAINISGNAATATTAGSAGSATTAGSAGNATQLTNSRTFTLTGPTTNATTLSYVEATSQSFNGTANVSIPITSIDAAIINQGTLAAARLTGTYTIDITGNASGNLRLDGTNTMAASTQLRLANFGALGAGETAPDKPSLTFTNDSNTGIYSPGDNANQICFSTGGTLRLTVANTIITATEPIEVPNPNTTAGGYLEVGFRKVPLASMTSGTLTAVTAGCMVAATGTITVNDGVFESGDTVSIWNNTASSITLAQAAGMTLYGDAAVTGNKTIPPRGLVTIWFYSGSVAKVTGEMS